MEQDIIANHWLKVIPSIHPSLSISSIDKLLFPAIKTAWVWHMTVCRVNNSNGNKYYVTEAFYEEYRVQPCMEMQWCFKTRNPAKSDWGRTNYVYMSTRIKHVLFLSHSNNGLCCVRANDWFLAHRKGILCQSLLVFANEAASTLYTDTSAQTISPSINYIISCRWPFISSVLASQQIAKYRSSISKHTLTHTEQISILGT